MTQRPRVTVLGSLNIDISVTVGLLAGPGETVLGSGAVIAPGGKGANQALAAARLGASARMVGCVGDDVFGAQLRSALRAGGADVAAVRTVVGSPSGIALITVDANGENAITVAPGANALVSQADADAAFSVASDALLMSAEIPTSVLAVALGRARSAGVTAVLNLAPAPPQEQSRELVAAAPEWLVVNGPEAGAILGRSVTGPGEAEIAAAELTGMGARHAVITLGAAGAVLGSPSGADMVPGFAVRSVDSVGAGDAFTAALGTAVAAGIGPAAAVRLACAAGAAAVTRRGAQDGLPGGADVLAATGVPWPLR